MLKILKGFKLILFVMLGFIIGRTFPSSNFVEERGTVTGIDSVNSSYTLLIDNDTYDIPTEKDNLPELGSSFIIVKSRPLIKI